MKTIHRLLLLAACLWAACVAPAATTETPTVAIVTYVTYPILDESVAGIKEALAKAGYAPPTARIIELNANGDPDKVTAIARELAQMKPTVIVPVSTPVTKVMIKQCAPDQPIVYSTVTNPSDVGMDARPANVTGVSDVVNFEGNMDLIRALFPRAKVIGIPYNPGEPNAEFGAREMQRLAGPRGITLKLVAVGNSAEAVEAARALAEQVDVIFIGSDNAVAAAVPGIVKVAHARNKPVIASDAGSVREGALAAVSVDYTGVGRRAGEIAAEVLRTKVLPGRIERVRFVGNALLLNERSAAALGYHFPEEQLRRAQEIIR